jgi:hypothetical protein
MSDSRYSEVRFDTARQFQPSDIPLREQPRSARWLKHSPELFAAGCAGTISLLLPTENVSKTGHEVSIW